MAEDNTDALRAMADALGSDVGPADHGKRSFQQFLRDSADKLEELRACIRKLCPEIDARKLLSFAAADAIFSEPRRDQ